MKIKCDTCNNRKMSDETSFGCGYVPFCIEGHWSGFCKEDYDDSEEYCTYRDKCRDYKSNLTDF